MGDELQAKKIEKVMLMDNIFFAFVQCTSNWYQSVQQNTD